MGCDMLVALRRATADGTALFGHNCGLPAGESLHLQRTPGREFAPDQVIHTRFVTIPQAAHTFTVLAGQPEKCWGYAHGINEHGVAAGCTSLRTRARSPRPGLSGPDLVRLLLERCRNARQAVDLFGDLTEQYGQGPGPDDPAAGEGDHAFLVADPDEAFLLEAAGDHWVCQEILEVRAAGDLCTIRQDWDRISHGLAELAIARKWWQEDGSKLDFAAALAVSAEGEESALRRWGRATLLLEQQNGRLDAPFLRRLLSDHDEDSEIERHPEGAGPVPLCCHPGSAAGRATAASVVGELGQGAERLPVVWYAFGPPCRGVYFPLFLEGDLPAALSLAGGDDTGSFWWRVRRLGEVVRGDPEQEHLLRENLDRLQDHYDREAREFAAVGAARQRAGRGADLNREASLFMQHVLDQYEETLSALGLGMASPAGSAEGCGDRPPALSPVAAGQGVGESAAWSDYSAG